MVIMKSGDDADDDDSNNNNSHFYSAILTDKGEHTALYTISNSDAGGRQ